MIKNYQQLQVAYYPNNGCTCTGDCTNYNSIVWAGVPVPQVDLDDKFLDFLKDFRYGEIDAKTESLIEVGFVFGGHTFSMSTNAQINWSNFPNIPDALFPLNIMDIVDNLYVLSLANKMNFYLTALGFKNTQLQSGSVLKSQIKTCADVACVNAVIDNR